MQQQFFLMYNYTQGFIILIFQIIMVSFHQYYFQIWIGASPFQKSIGIAVDIVVEHIAGNQQCFRRKLGHKIVEPVQITEANG
ncbi:hypothetical protein D3C87_1662270 [compost metagenome]